MRERGMGSSSDLVTPSLRPSFSYGDTILAMSETRAAFAIEARDLVKQYGELTAVDHIQFTVKHGEAFGLLGPNGAGKSTTMRMIYCRTPLTAGTLLVDGLDVTAQPRQIKARVGVVPQENNLDPDLNVRENLLVYARYFGIKKAEAEQRAQEALQLVALTEKRAVPVEELSGGMKRRLMIARAVLNRPSILILDEPTTGLDPHVRHALWETLRELRARGITILLSTHYMDEAEKLCERLLIINDGKILVSGTPRALIAAHASSFALEVQAETQHVIADKRGATHFYFAPSSELLAPLIKSYQGCETYLRPSNLEDVFLRLTERERLH
jgi:lipooligosaccharide transport system ATP-binding protein